MALSLGAAAASTQVVDVLAATRRLLYGRERQSYNQLANDLTTTDETVTFTQSLNGVQAGATICVGIEEMLVWSVNTSAGSAQVQRGMAGSVAASHTAGDLVSVNPKFSDWEIFAALNNDLLDLSSPENGLYQIRTLDLTAKSGVVGYDFPTVGFLDVADIRWQVPGGVTHAWREISDWRISENMPTATFPSGTAIFFTVPILAQQTIRIRYKAQFTPITSTADDVPSTTGLPPSCLDIPPLGAAVRLMDGRPIGRADYLSQGDTRRADEVRVGDVLSASQKLEIRRAKRINAEFLRLSAIWEQRQRARIRL